MSDRTQGRLPLALLGLRLSLALVFAVWAADKFIQPEHGASILAGFYGLQDVSHTLIYAAGAAQALLVAAFALGLVLFIVPLILNLIALRVVRRYREAYE